MKPISFIKNTTGKKKGYPGAQPSNLNLKYKYNWKDWFISNKFDGERILLFGYENKSFSLNRKNELSTVNFFIRNGDIFDTEKVNNNYYILDFIAENGKLLDIPFYKRIDAFKKIPSYSKSNLKSKLFLDFKKENKIKLESELKKIHTKFEGYIFTFKRTKITFNTTKNILKWKPLELNTVDFLYLDGKLFVGDNKGLKQVGILLPTETEIPESSIIECTCVLNGNDIYWNFFRFRNDKLKPNFITVYYNTLNTISNFKELVFP